MIEGKTLCEVSLVSMMTQTRRDTRYSPFILLSTKFMNHLIVLLLIRTLSALSYVSWELAVLLGRLQVRWRRVLVWEQRLAGTNTDEPLVCLNYLLVFDRRLHNDLKNAMTFALRVALSAL